MELILNHFGNMDWIELFFFSFLSSFLPLSKEVDCSAEGKFISPYMLCFYKWRHHINVLLHTLSTKVFLSNSSHILLTKSQTPCLKIVVKTWVKNGNTFDWLEIYEPMSYFPFLTRIFKNGNMLLNVLILMIILVLKKIKMKEITVNSSITSTINLDTNFTKFLNRDYSLHLQLIWRNLSVCEMKYCTLES